MTTVVPGETPEPADFPTDLSWGPEFLPPAEQVRPSMLPESHPPKVKPTKAPKAPRTPKPPKQPKPPKEAKSRRQPKTEVATQVPQAPLAPDGNLGTSPWAVPLLIHAKDDQVAQVKEDKPKKDKKSGKSWGLIIVLALMVLLISGGIGAIAGSNVVARAGYESRLASSMTVAVLKIPRLGDDYAVPILEGTSWAELRQGVGWYAKTGRPAEIGNFALAGHRLGWGQPFANLDSLEVGDEIQVVVNGKTFTYLVITGPTVFSNESVDVIAPVPGDPDRLPTKPLITLTTAASMLPSPDRLVVIGELVLD